MINSLERLVPRSIQDGEVTGQETLHLHLARYAFAASHLRPGRTLDVACGVGYGTRLLWDQGPDCTEVIGVDQSSESIDHALQYYSQTGILFRVDNAMTFQDELGYDNIVSLETIEHLPDPSGFISHILTLLKPGGMFIGSVPTTPTVDANPHHLHDFTEKSFRRLLHSFGMLERNSLRQIQRFNPYTILARQEARLSDLRSNLVKYYCHHPVSFLRRILSTLRYGFSNRYITIAWEKPH